MSTCRVISCVVVKGCLPWLVCSLDKTLLVFALLHLYSKTKLACYSGYLLTPTFVSQSPMMKRTFFLVLVLEGVVGQFQLLQHQWLGYKLGLL